jgi:hypothetical protein
MLRKGRTKIILESSIDSALLAVEIYNKPRTPFRVENYISLMVIAWTRLFHAHFYHTIGDKYYHKLKNSNRYQKVDGEKKSWELKTCINRYRISSEPIKANLLFFIKLRNKVEHGDISKENIGLDIFGECQSLLYNYEKMIVKLFGKEYTLDENLAFSLQFSQTRSEEQKIASKKMLSREITEIKKFIEKYRSTLGKDVFNSQEYSVKLIQIPRILNNPKRNVPAIEFVKWSNLSEKDKENYEKLTVLIKNKTVKIETINPGKLKAGCVLEKVLESMAIKKFSHYDHKCLYYLFSIRPISEEKIDEFETNTKYCNYDEAHNDYLYQKLWPEFLARIINEKKINKKQWKQKFRKRQKIDIRKYE